MAHVALVLGLIGGGYGDAEWLQEQAAHAGGARVGYGFITWSLAKQPFLLDLALEFKPIAVMRWLCRLVTPPGGTILDDSVVVDP